MTHKKKHEDPIEEPGDEKIEAEEPAPINEEADQPDWQAKAEEYLTDLKRCQADFENYKRRQQESQKELGGYLIEKLVLDIIPVLDNFRSATMHVPAEQKESPWVVGIQYIEKQLETVLTDNGMQTIEAKEGDEFDPKLHEAVDYDKAQETSDKEQDEEPAAHTIAKVIQKGYRLGDKVIRAARVIVR